MAEEAVRRVPWAQVKREATVLTETRRSVARVAVAVRAIPRRLVAPEEMEVHRVAVAVAVEEELRRVALEVQVGVAK